jgi:hypothetical protein
VASCAGVHSVNAYYQGKCGGYPDGEGEFSDEVCPVVYPKRAPAVRLPRLRSHSLKFELTLLEFQGKGMIERQQHLHCVWELLRTHSMHAARSSLELG